jgi:hypothetical protein
MNDKKAGFASGTYVDVPNPRAGAAGTAALANSEGQNAAGGLGPAHAIALEFLAYTPVGTGQLLITGYMHVVNATPGQLTAFNLSVNGVDEALDEGLADASGNKSSSLSAIVPCTAGVAMDIILRAAAASDLTSPAKHQSLNVVEMP